MPETITKESRDKIREALDLLQQAAKTEKDHLKSVVSDGYSDLKNVLGEARTGMAERVRVQRERLAEVKDHGVERARQTADHVDQYVHEQPWKVLGLATAAALLLGYLMGRDRR